MKDSEGTVLARYDEIFQKVLEVFSDAQQAMVTHLITTKKFLVLSRLDLKKLEIDR